MIRFTQAQKDEFDKLYKDHDSMSILDAMLRVQNFQSQYPVLYFYLFGSGDDSKNQNEFIQAWLDIELIKVTVTRYYLVVFPAMYVSIDPDNNIVFTTKYDNSKMYQKQFTQLEVNNLQQEEQFSNRINLDACKVEVNEDDKKNPLTSTTTTTQLPDNNDDSNSSPSTTTQQP